MNVTATTRLTADECMDRLDALRPMPRGERLAEHAPDPDVARRLAWPVLRLRMRCRFLRESMRQAHSDLGAMIDTVDALRSALADVIGPPCDKQGRWCHTHQTKDCRADDARKLLVVTP